MPIFKKRLRWARGILAVAAVLFGIGQFLPWETIHMHTVGHGLSAAEQGSSRFLPVEYGVLIVPEIVYEVSPALDEISPAPVKITESNHVLSGPYFWKSLAEMIGEKCRRPAFLWHDETAMLFYITLFCLATVCATVLQPFFAGVFTRTRFFLWTFRIWIPLSAMWMVVRLAWGAWKTSPLSWSDVGSGYWLIVVAFLLQSIALFVIPKADGGNEAPAIIAEYALLRTLGRLE